MGNAIAMLPVVASAVVAVAEVVKQIISRRPIKSAPMPDASTIRQHQEARSDQQGSSNSAVAITKTETLPPADPGQLREEARKKLGIDSVACYNFGFAGNTGTGKSSLINALRGLADDHPDAAKTGETECTDVVSKYPHKKYSHIVFWDLPGCGTAKYPSKTYFTDLALYAFDTIVIVGCGRFTETDIAIARDANLFGIPTAFVHTKSDIDIDARSRKSKKAKSEIKHELKKEVVDNINDQLKKAAFKDKEVFYLSSRVYQEELDEKDYGLDELDAMKYVIEAAYKRRN